MNPYPFEIVEGLSQLEKQLGYDFHDISILCTALCHASYANEHKSPEVQIENNERLEFLGDCVLSLIVSEYIYHKYANITEGEMTKLRSAVVRDKALASYSRQLGLGQFLFLGQGENSALGRDRMSTLENAFEAVVAAIYLDGGMEEARKFVLPFVKETVESYQSGESAHDHKTALQEWIQRSPDNRLEYVVVGESGLAHAKEFTVEARLNGKAIGKGLGSSKRRAEQAAAGNALKKVTK